MLKMKDMIKEVRESFNDEKIFYNKKLKKFIIIDEYYLCVANGKTYKRLLLPWQVELVELGRVIINNYDNYIESPSRRDINEYELMYRFINEKLFEEERKEILEIIEGRNILNRFKSAIEGMYYEKLWDIFIDEEVEKLCKKWCLENNIGYL